MVQHGTLDAAQPGIPHIGAARYPTHQWWAGGSWRSDEAKTEARAENKWEEWIKIECTKGVDCWE